MSTKRPESARTRAWQAEGGGFEPPMTTSAIPVFETGAFNHSATPPGVQTGIVYPRSAGINWCSGPREGFGEFQSGPCRSDTPVVNGANPASVPHPLAARRGAVAVAMVLVLVMLSLVVVTMLLSGARDHELDARKAEGLRSFYAAEASIQMAFRELVLGVDESGEGEVGGIAAFSLGSVVASVHRDDAGASITLTSQASAGQAKRSSQLTLQQSKGSSGGDPGAYVEVWALSSEPGSIASVNWNAPPTWVGVVPEINFPLRANSSARFTGQPAANFALRITANVTVPSAGTWTFSTASDGASDLSIDGVTLLTNPGSSSMPSVNGSATLAAESHALVVRMIEGSGSNGLTASWHGPGVSATSLIPRTALTTFSSVPALAVAGTVYFYGDGSGSTVLVDGYESTAGEYGGSNALYPAVVSTNSTTSSSWHMTGSAQLLGDAVVGVGGNPASVISMWGGTITGARAAAATNTASFILSPAVSLPASSGSVARWAGPFSFAGNARYNSLTLGGSTTATVSGDCVVQVDGSLAIQDTATLTLLSGSSLTLYVGGAVNFYGTAKINTSAAASRLRIYMTGSSNLQVTDQTELSAWVINPFGSLLVYSTGGTAIKSFCGRYWGGAASLTDKSKVHLDLSSSGSGSSSTLQTIVESYRQVAPH